MTTRRWKVAELASATGVLARTLHFYDEIGLLVPSERPPGGPRLYTESDVPRLYRIVVLRRLGHPVKSLRSQLAGGGMGLLETLRLQLDQAEGDLTGGPALRERLLTMAELLERGAEPSSEQLIDALKAIDRR